VAIYHLSMQTISRGKGKSAVASAAYRSCEKLVNEYDNITHDYSNKKDLVHKEIIAPDNSPDWIYERQKLWNEVEKVETRKNAQLGRELNVALPVELDLEKQKELVKNFASIEFVSKGMIADICIHDKGDGNPHAHIMLTRREINENGFGEVKKEWTGTQEYFKGRASNAQKEIVEEIRTKWAECVNNALEHVGSQQRVDHRSFKDQGIDKVPTIHEGATVRKMEKKGVETEKGAYNRRVQANNKMIELIDRQINLLENQKEVLEHGREQDNRVGKQTLGDRNTTPTDAAIIFGGRGENQIHSKRADQFIGADKKQNERGRSSKGKIGSGFEEYRNKESGDNREVEQGNSRVASGDGRLKENEHGYDRENLQDIVRGNEKERGAEQRNNKTDHGLEISGQKNRETNVDRDCEEVCDRPGDNNRDSSHVSGDMEGSITIDSIVQALSKSIEKAEQKEEENRKMFEKQNEKVKSRSNKRGHRRDGGALDSDRNRGGSR
jgi:hypothetical protein